jgi:hypothetical protein
VPRTPERLASMYRRALLIWLGIAAAIVLNDVLRSVVYQPLFGHRPGENITNVVAILVIVGVSYLFVSRQPEVGHRFWVRVGMLWLGLTAALDVALRLFGVEYPGDTLFADYDILRGRIRSLLLLSALVAPIYWSRTLYRRENARLWFKP